MTSLNQRNPRPPAMLLLLMAMAAFRLIPNKTAAAGAGLDWQTAPGYRWRALPVPAAGKTGFTLLPPETTGIFFTNHLSEFNATKNRILQNGSGVALGDVDGDGWCDIYFCRLEGPNALYRNLGNGKFEDITRSAGVACEGQFSTGAVFADL